MMGRWGEGGGRRRGGGEWERIMAALSISQQAGVRLHVKRKRRVLLTPINV